MIDATNAPLTPGRSATETFCSPRSAARLIGTGAVLSVLVMSHHPSVSASGMAGFVRETVAEAGQNRAVHGALVAIHLVTVPGFVVFSRALGQGLSAWLALVAHVAGVLALCGAALLGGFATPALAEHYVDATAVDLERARHAFRALGSVQHVLAEVGIVVLAAAIAAWSLNLLRRRTLARVTGVVGWVLGAGVTAMLVSGHLTLHVHGMQSVVLGIAVWNVLAAVWLARRAGVATEPIRSDL